MNRRALLNTTALLTPVVALAACSPIQNAVTQLGGPATAAQVTKVLTYIQGGVSVLSTVVAVFGPMIPAPYNVEVSTALTALTAATGAFGQALSGGSTATTAATGIQGVENLFNGVTSALLSGLQALPNPNSTIKTAIATVQSVQTWTPTITGLINSILGIVTPTVTAAMVSTFSPARLGVMVP